MDFYIGFGYSVTSVLIVIFVGMYFYNKGNKKSISFRDGFALTDLPIIVLEQEGVLLTFLLDTGASHSHFDKKYLKLLNTYEELNEKSEWVGMNNIKQETDLIGVFLNYHDQELYTTLNISELVGLEQVKQETGIIINGILGSDFLNKYGFLIDYKKLHLTK